MDIAGSLGALVLLSPILLAAALAVMIESGRPVLFRQIRVGQGEREFWMFKFRSMAQDAPSRGAYWTTDADPRITRVGRVIRRTSIDELPQILNVLRGEMSLVGPRPDVPAQRGNYTKEQWAERCSVRPGLTGLAQVEMRSIGTPAQRLALDLQYVRERSVAMDFRIVWRTIGRLWGGGGN